MIQIIYSLLSFTLQKISYKSHNTKDYCARHSYALSVYLVIPYLEAIILKLPHPYNYMESQ